MSDGVLAAIIAACATVFASFMQIRSSFAKEVAGRAFPSTKGKKSRAPFMFMIMMLGGAAVGGFALSQWLMENERSMQSAYQQDTAMAAKLWDVSTKLTIDIVKRMQHY